MGIKLVDFRDYLGTKLPGSIQQFVAKPDIADFARLAVGVFVFSLLIMFPPPPWLTSIVVVQRDWIRLLVLLAFFIFLLNKNKGGWETVQIAFAFALFAIPLVYKWQFAQSDGNIIGGLIPWSDAAGYNWEAHRLANGTLLSTWGARRPLFSGFLAVLLRSAGGDFMAVLILLSLINTLAVCFVVRWVKHLYGGTAAAFFLILSFEFYIRFAGLTLTEQLGFALANLALFFLLVGTHMRSLWRVLFGLGLLTLALNARAGAFFILPALTLWLGLYFRQQTSLWRSIGSAIVVVTAGFLLNYLLVRVIAEPQGVPFSNYSYTLYGLASGNKGWDQVIKDHPDVSEQEVMPLAIQKIRSEPTLFLRGMISSFTDYFGADRGAFAYSFLGSIRRTINFGLWILIIAGLVYSITQWQQGLPSLMLASFLGVIASIPLLPPIDSDRMRVYAATIPFSALWVVTGIYAFSRWGRNLIIRKAENNTENATKSYFQKPALFSAVLLVFLAVPAPILLTAYVRPPNSVDSSSQPACQTGQELINVIKFDNMSVVIIPNEAATESYMPFIRKDDFQNAVRRASGSSLYPFLGDELLDLRAGDQISFGSKSEGLMHISNLWMVSKFSIGEGELSLCGRATDNKELQYFNFYYLEGTSMPIASLTTSQENPAMTQSMRWLYVLSVGIVAFLAVSALIGVRQLSLVGILYTIGILVLILPGVFVNLYVNGKLLSLPISTQQRFTLTAKNAVPVEGNLYTLSLGIDWMSHADLGLSPAVVYENDTPLGLPNAMHQAIIDEGKGRYSVWDGYLYFSSSDNTDPRVNGRVYELEWPRPISLNLQRLSYLMSLLGIVLLFYGKYSRERLMDRPTVSAKLNIANDVQ